LAVRIFVDWLLWIIEMIRLLVWRGLEWSPSWLCFLFSSHETVNISLWLFSVRFGFYKKK
jgi:hypothetical protein